MPHSLTPGELEAHYRYLRRVAPDLAEDDHLADNAAETVMLQTLRRERGAIGSLHCLVAAIPVSLDPEGCIEITLSR